MKHLTKYALLLTVCVMAHKASAQEANKTSFSLQEAIDYAMKNSPNYLNAEQDLKAAEYRKNEVTGMGLPQVSGSIDVKDYIEIPTSLIPAVAFNSLAPSDQYFAVKFGTKYNTTAGLSASQLIFNSDYIFGLKASKAFMNVSRINVMRSKSELASQVSKAYYMVLISRERIKLLDVNLSRLKKTYDDLKATNLQGLVEQIDVERVEVQYNNVITEKEKVTQLIGLSEAALKFQMGYDLGNPVTLTDSLNINGVLEQLAAGRIDVAQRPDYQLLQAQQTLYDIDVKRLKWGYMPTLAAYGSYQFNTQRNEFGFGNDKTNPAKQWYRIALVGVTLNVNIFDGLQRHYKIQQAKITALKNQNTLKNLMMAGELEAESARIMYNNAYTTLSVQKRNMELAKHVYDVAQKKYDNGVGNNLEIVIADGSLKEAQTNYINSVYDMLVARIDYQRATGSLVK